MPLSLRLRAEARDRLPGRVDADLAGVEHLDAQDVEVLRRSGAHDFGERGDAETHEFAAGALLLLLPAEVGVADQVHGLGERRLVVPAVVVPAERRAVRELFRLHEVAEPEVGGVLAQLAGHEVHHPLDGVHRLGDPERTAVGDASRRLVRVHAVHFHMGVGQVVGAGADVEEAGRELGRVRRGVGVAVVGDRAQLQRGQSPVLRSQPGGDVVVAGEGVRLQVLRTVLDPLHRFAGDHRSGGGDDIARIHRHLAAEAAADVRGDHPDLVFRESEVGGDQGDHGADRVRGLRREVEGEVAFHRIPTGDAAAGLDRGHMDARDVHLLLDDHLGVPERGFGLFAVAVLPVPDVVALLVVAHLGGAGLQRLVRIHHHRQRVVVHFERGDAVGGSVAGSRHHRRHFLRLVLHGVHRQHHLLVAHQRGHPRQLVLLERLPGDDRGHSGNGGRRLLVDLRDLRVGVRAPRDVEVEHLRQDDVVDVVALAAQEAGVFLAEDGVSEAPALSHRSSPSSSRRRAAPLSRC